MYTRKDYAKTRSKEKVPRNILRTVIGEYMLSGEPVVHCFEERHDNILILGETASGKTSLGNLIQYDIIKAYGPNIVQFVKLDFKGTSGRFIGPYYSYVADIGVEDNLHDCIKAIKQLSEWWEEHKLHHHQRYTIVIVDELPSLCGRTTNSLWLDAMLVIRDIADEGFKYKTFLINISNNFYSYERISKIEFYNTKVFLSSYKNEELANFCRLFNYRSKENLVRRYIGYVSMMHEVFVPYYTVYVSEQEVIECALAIDT